MGATGNMPTTQATHCAIACSTDCHLDVPRRAPSALNNKCKMERPARGPIYDAAAADLCRRSARSRGRGRLAPNAGVDIMDLGALGIMRGGLRIRISSSPRLSQSIRMPGANLR